MVSERERVQAAGATVQWLVDGWRVGQAGIQVTRCRKFDPPVTMNCHWGMFLGQNTSAYILQMEAHILKAARILHNRITVQFIAISLCVTGHWGMQI